MTKDEALKLALEALEIQLENSNGEQKYADAIAEIKALAQPVQEPVYWLGYGLQAHTEKPFESATALYTTPPLPSQPVQPADLQQRLADLHLYEEIAEHYAKCAISPEALRDWVSERMDTPSLPVQERVTRITWDARGVRTVDGVPDDAPQPMQEPVAHSVISGALFDFMGWLTSREERLVVSSADNASPAVDAIRDFASKRGLSLNDAQVREWIDALAQPVQGTMFKVGVAKRKWESLQADGHEMQHIAFAKGFDTGIIDAWGKVVWRQSEPLPVQEPVADSIRARG